MSLSTLLSTLLSGSEGETDSPTTVGDQGDEPAITVLHECRDCGTNVSAETTCCPVCDSEDIVTYSID